MVRAIDIHIHPPMPGRRTLTDDPEIAKYFRSAVAHSKPEEMAEMYAELDIFGVLFQIDFETASGSKPIPNDYIAELVQRYPKQFVGFGSVDPWKGQAGVEELERSVTELGLKGLKLHPIHQAFFPDDKRFYPLYEKCQELGVPLLMHTGFAAAGVGMPGGGGFKLKYSRPIPGVDDVAADFPDLTIIMAHPAWPWVEEQIAVALHKPNVYLDLSGWAPRFIPEVLVRETNTRLSDKVLFGSDFPYLTPDRWLKGFDELPIKDEVRPKVLLDNARRVLGL